MHKLELVLLVGDHGVDVLGNMVGGLLGCHVEVQMGEPITAWFGGSVAKQPVFYICRFS